MQPAKAVVTRNRAIIGIRAGTIAAILGSLGLTWLFASLAEAYFSGKPAEVVVPPVPQLPAPVQKAPTIIQKVVHKTGTAPTGAGTNPRPPSSHPAPAPAPAPPPACHSTPSKPC
ncbi:MAG TPA: hypothetical protein VFB69_08555 [Candidatus Dormibacteraeota bacterium]|nr:hypothetical protein [Candidatus Dormibacteraeota bacterium]